MLADALAAESELWTLFVQVQQVKKSGKFACSVCGARQSVRQVGTVGGRIAGELANTQIQQLSRGCAMVQASCCSDRAKDVRLVVMELNFKHGLKRQAEDKLLGQVQEPTMVPPAQEAVAGTCAPEWDPFVVRPCTRPPMELNCSRS